MKLWRSLLALLLALLLAVPAAAYDYQLIDLTKVVIIVQLLERVSEVNQHHIA